jgi:hypothetical protein
MVLNIPFSLKNPNLACLENHLHQWMVDKHAVDRIAVLFIQDPQGEMDTDPGPFGVSRADFVVLVAHNAGNRFPQAHLIGPNDAKLPIAGILNIRTFLSHDD